MFTIVGADEFDGARGEVIWVSPVGGTLLGSSAGDLVSFATIRPLSSMPLPGAEENNDFYGGWLWTSICTC